MEFTNKLVAQVFGIVLVLVGLVGFVMDPVLVFDVNTAHNVVHLLSGAALLGAAYYNNGGMAKQANITIGAVYLLVTLAGFLNLADINTLLAINNADNWLHLLLGVVLVGTGYAAKR